MSDFHKMSALMKDLFPSNPEADKQALKAMAGHTEESAPTTKNYIQESTDVAQGSLAMDKDYSISDFAKLAGVQINETQKEGPAGQLKGKDAIAKQPAMTTNNPTRDKLVGEEDQDLAEPVFIRQEPKDAMSQAQRQLKQGMELIAKGSAMIDEAQAKIKEFTNTLSDRTLTKGEEKEKERLVKGMKKNKSDFKDRYGKDAEAVMYATATKNAKNESTHSSIKDRLLAELNKRK
jgi:hypothetical protein